MLSAAAPGDGEENLPAQAVPEQRQLLREQAVRRVLSSGVLNTVKAHLRAQLYAELKGGGGSTTALLQARQGTRPSLTLRQHVLNCLVAEHLLSQRYKYSLSVFLSESGSDALPHLSHTDTLRLMGVLPESKVHALLLGSTDGGSSGSSMGTQAAERRVAGPSAASDGRSGSLVEGMVAVLGVLGGQVTTHSTACQTCTAGSTAASAAAVATASSEQLAQRLEQIEAEYRRRSGALEAAAAGGLEERMAAYRRECDARCAAQLQERLAELREGELAAVREQEASRHRQQVEAERLALRAAHQEQLAKLHAQEAELLERGRRQQRELDLAREEHLQHLRGVEDRLAAQRTEEEAKLAAALAAAQQQEAAAAAAQRQAEEQRAAGEQRLQAALAEAQRGEAAAAAAQAAAEADMRRVAALQQQLAEALQEQGGLRQALATERASHQADRAELQAEAEALRQDKERLAAAAAAAAAAPCLSPDEAARLQRAVRRLMQRVEELQVQAEAAGQRERLWKGSAGQAERLLSKAAKAHDRTLRHGEELRLALAAAVREAEGLQQQAALAAAGAPGPLAAALQSAVRDMQRWREGVEARLGAVQREEGELRREAAQLRQRALEVRSEAAQGLQQLLAAHLQGRRMAEASTDGDSPAALPPQDHMYGAGAAAAGNASSQPIKQADRVRPAPAVQQQLNLWPQQVQVPDAVPAPQKQAAPQLSLHATPHFTEPSSSQVQPPPQAQHAQVHGKPSPSIPSSTTQQLQPAAPGVSRPSSTLQQQQQQQQQQPPNVAAAKPPNRTASDILAAYRARQQRAAAPAPSRSRSASLSQEAAESSEGRQQVRPGSGSGRQEHELPAAAAQQQEARGEQATAAVGLGSGEAGGGGLGVPEGYYSVEFTSEDSSRF